MLHSAVLGMSTAAVEMLLENQKCIELVNAENHNGNTALLTAADNGCNDIVLLFLQKGKADVNKVNPRTMESALMLAAIEGHRATVRVLLEHPDIEVNLADIEGASAFHKAAYMNHPTVCQLLLERPDLDIAQVIKVLW